MAVWQWKDDYISRRYFRVEADSEEEAKAAKKLGNYDEEWEVDFFLYDEVEKIHKIED